MRPEKAHSAILAAALILAAACGKTQEESRAGKPSRPAAAADLPLADALAGQPRAQPGQAEPAWTRESPHFFSRGGLRFGSAVGWARSGNIALARAAAEDRARVDLLRLIKGVKAEEAVAGALPGARIMDSFTSSEGKVFVRVEVGATPAP